MISPFLSVRGRVVFTVVCGLVVLRGMSRLWSAEDSGSRNGDIGSAAVVQARAENGICEFLLNGQTVLEYRYPSRGPKSYVSSLASPRGVNVLRDSPPDHVHHHALMFAVGVDGVDYWAEGPGCGIQVPEGGFECLSDKSEKRVRCRLSHRLRWQVPDRNDQLQEERTIELIRDPRTPQATLLVWTSKLAVPAGQDRVELWGRPYFGLGLRFVESMDSNGRLFNSLGETGVEGTNNRRAQWCAYTAKAGDETVTVVVMDHPENPRTPATWFTMDKPFAYVSATLNLANEKFIVNAEKPTVLRYGVAVCDGALESSTVQELYSVFCEYAR